jgi:hypothetical protein
MSKSGLPKVIITSTTMVEIDMIHRNFMHLAGRINEKVTNCGKGHSSFIGTLRFHRIMYGINGFFEHDEGGDDDPSTMGHEDVKYMSDNSGYPYFVAYHQFHAFFAWLCRRDNHARMYCESEVCRP